MKINTVHLAAQDPSVPESNPPHNDPQGRICMEMTSKRLKWFKGCSGQKCTTETAIVGCCSRSKNINFYKTVGK